MNAKQRLNKKSYMFNNALLWIKKVEKKKVFAGQTRIYSRTGLRKVKEAPLDASQEVTRRGVFRVGESGRNGAIDGVGRSTEAVKQTCLATGWN